jgi:glycosyltransferase involved in cell wall biosynthesis
MGGDALQARATVERPVNVMLLASSLYIGGAETVIRHLAERIDRRRFNVTVCCLKARGQIGDELVRGGTDVTVIAGASNAGRVDYFTSLKLRRVIKAKRVDVIHSHTTHALVDAAVCKLTMPSLKVLHTFHYGNYPHVEPRNLLMERTFSRVVTSLFSVGETQKRQLQTVYGFDDRRIKTIRNGVALSASAGDAEYRRRIGAADRLLIGTIATLIEQKGLHDLLSVARRVRDAGHNPIFVVLGEGYMRAELEARRAQLGLEDTVLFPGWLTNAAEVALPTFDIFFQPSLWEAMSMVVLEGMSASKAIVATRVGENGHIIEHGVNGLLAEAKDVDGLAACLMQLIENPALRETLGRAARHRVEREFTVDHMTRAYEREYLEALR